MTYRKEIEKKKQDQAYVQQGELGKLVLTCKKDPEYLQSEFDAALLRLTKHNEEFNLSGQEYAIKLGKDIDPDIFVRLKGFVSGFSPADMLKAQRSPSSGGFHRLTKRIG